MSMFEDSQYRWRETYFVMFRSSDRPTLKLVEKTLAGLNANYVLTNLSGDESGMCDSLSVLSPDDFAALDICYVSGAEVLENAAELVEEIIPAACDPGETVAAEQIKQCDARFDVLHFEHVSDFPEEEDDADEIIDPAALILVLSALAKITGGIAIDPQAGSILENGQ